MNSWSTHSAIAPFALPNLVVVCRSAPNYTATKLQLFMDVPQNRFASFAERARLAAAVPLVALRHRGTTAMRNAGMPFRFTPCHTVTSHQPRALGEIFNCFLLYLQSSITWLNYTHYS